MEHPESKFTSQSSKGRFREQWRAAPHTRRRAAGYLGAQLKAKEKVGPREAHGVARPSRHGAAQSLRPNSADFNLVSFPYSINTRFCIRF